MYWDKRGILKIYNFCRRGQRNSPHFVRHISQGRFSFRKRTAPARPQENARGCRPLTPELPILNFISAAVCKCTGAAQPRLLPLSIWCASCGRCRSAAGLRRRFIPSPLGKPARLYKIRSPAAASRRSTAHTAHRLSYPRHTFSFCTAQHNAHNQVPYTAPTISHSAAEKICSPHSPCTFLRFSISVIVTITLRLWKVNLSFVKMFASC